MLLFCACSTTNIDGQLWCAGEVLLGDLTRAGFEVTADHNAADAIVVNTCAFVEVSSNVAALHHLGTQWQHRQRQAGAWHQGAVLSKCMFQCTIQSSC